MNSKLRFPKDKSEKSNMERWNYTEEQRTLAAGATTSRDLDDFQKKVVGFLCILIIFAYDAYS